MPTLDFNINVNFSLIDECEPLVAAKIVDPDNYLMDRNSAEANDYIAFIDNLLALLDYYDFAAYSDSYRWPLYCYYLQYNLQIAENNAPTVVKVTVSQHLREYTSTVHLENTEQKQRYRIKYITVNNNICSTYTDALDNIELKLREWFKELHIPLDDYEYIGNWE